MKPFEKTKDGVVDNLLRAFLSRPNPEKACTEFDPDLANAYIERSLTPGVRTRYEGHLSECGACRKGIVVLKRLYDADNPASAFSAKASNRRTRWFAGASQVFGMLTRPQWVLASAAVIVLAISLPVIMLRNETRRSDSVAKAVGEQAPQPESPQNTNQPTVSNPATSSKSPSADPAISPAATAKPSEKSDNGALAISSPAPTAGAPGGSAGTVEQAAKPETKPTPQPAADEARVTSANKELTPAQGGAAAGTQVAKKESDQDRKQQEGKDSAQQTADATQERADEPRDKEKTAKADEPPAPSASASEAARGRPVQKRSPAKLALRDSSPAESVRPLDAQKKIGNKRFLFKDNTWTDRDFDPGKDFPVVTIIRDSNVYKEEISKRAGLKVYLEGFGGSERAIIVYKGTVYKLIPQ